MNPDLPRVHRRMVGLWSRGGKWVLADVKPSLHGGPEVRFHSYPMEGPHMASEALPRGISRAACVVGLPGFQVVYRQLSKRRVGDWDPDTIVEHELEHFSGLPADEAAAGTCAALHSRQLWFSLTRRDRVENAIQTADEHGFRLDEITPAGLGLFETVRHVHPLQEGEVVVAVELDQGHGEFIVCSRDELFYARGLEGLPRPGTEDSEERILAQLEASLDLYREKSPPDQNPTLLLLHAPPGKSGFRARLRDRLGLDCANLTFPGHAHPDSSPVALGLALTARRPSSQRLSLLPEEIRNLVRAAGRNHYWTATALILVLIPLVLALGLKMERSRIASAISSLRGNIQQIEARTEHLEKRSQQIQQLREDIVPLQRSEFSSEEAKAVLEAVGSAKNSEDWVTLISDSESYFSGLHTDAALPSPTPAAGSTSNRYYVVEGYTSSPDLASVQAFITQLKQHPAMVSADLLGDDLVRDLNNRDVVWNGVPATPFAVEVEVRLK